MKNAAKLLYSRAKILKASLPLFKKDVLVGVPNESPKRKAEGEAVGPMNNATLAYIHDNGSPAANIPARPFMQPGIASAKERIVSTLLAGAKANIAGNTEAIENALHKTGLIAQAQIRSKINEGIAPELAPRTLAARRARGRTGTKPLIDTGQLRNSINYVIRENK